MRPDQPEETTPVEERDERAQATSKIAVRGATLHNLKSVDCDIPHGRLTVVTGVSGSGKSSLAFDTVFAEGQRRYLQTFSTYTQQFLDRVKKPPVEALRNMLPAVALRQHNSITQPRSTVGTVTEISDYLGLLFTGAGVIECRACGTPVQEDTPATVAAELCGDLFGHRIVLFSPVELLRDGAVDQVAELMRDGYGRVLEDGVIRRLEQAPPAWLQARNSLAVIIDRLRVDTPSLRLSDAIERGFALGSGEIGVLDADEGASRNYFRDLRCNSCGETYQKPSAPLFSFNSPLGACGRCSGHGRAMGLDNNRIIPNPRRSIAAGAILPFQEHRGRSAQRALKEFCRRRRIPLDQSWNRLTTEQQEEIFAGDEMFAGVRGFFRVLEGERHNPSSAALLARYRSYTTCGDCGGSRLSRNARAVGVRGRNIADLSDLSIAQLHDFLRGLELTDLERASSGEVIDAITRRLATLVVMGVGYISLQRMTRSLSSGELQRIQLSACLNRGLVDTCYVLDEPTAGLHPRDTGKLVEVLRALCGLGNTVLVVEHDHMVIEAADHLIELGPVGGEEGGYVLFEGSLEGLRETNTPTSKALATPPTIARHGAASFGSWLSIRGASANNLKNVDVRFPRKMLTSVTGVSGSGKSTLVFDVLEASVKSILERNRPPDPRLCAGLTGAQHFHALVAMSQTTLSSTVRSTVLTRSGALEPIRKSLSDTSAARARALTPLHFSANVKGGRCEACEGLGIQRVDMHFMADVHVVCESCTGRRFKDVVLEAELCGKNIDQIHKLTVDEAIQCFSSIPEIVLCLEPIAQVALGYLRLGQPIRTLSGGEAQRLRIAEHIVQAERARESGPTLFLFDEPSIGLHQADTAVLIRLFRELCELGNTVIVVEHNLDIIAASDWVVDLGPEAGDEGGFVVSCGEPQEIAACVDSRTGAALRTVAGDESASAC